MIVTQALTDGIMTRDEENQIRASRDHLALEESVADQETTWDLDQASGERLTMQARLARHRRPRRVSQPIGTESL